MKKLTLVLNGYTVKGVSDLTLWGGGNASIQMNQFNITSVKELPTSLNDAGFGVESINGAICDIYRNYQGTLVYARTLTIGKVSEITFDTYLELL